MLIMLGGFLMITLALEIPSLYYLGVCVAVIGLGMGLQTPSLMLAVQHSLEPRHIGVATSTQMLARTIGGAIGISVMGSAVAGLMGREFRRLANEVPLDSLRDIPGRLYEP